MTPLKKAQQKYEKTRTIKKVSFNDDLDADLIEHLKDKEFSSYIKTLIRNDINIPVEPKDIPVNNEALPRDPNTVDWVDDQPKVRSDLERYRYMILRAHRGDFTNFPTDISHLTVDMINEMSIDEIREYTGYI